MITSEDHHHHDQYGFWDTLAIRPGVYDILKLRNGIDTLLGTVNIPSCKNQESTAYAGHQQFSGDFRYYLPASAIYPGQ